MSNTTRRVWMTHRDAAPPEYEGLGTRAVGLLDAAWENLGINREEHHV